MDSCTTPICHNLKWFHICRCKSSVISLLEALARGSEPDADLVGDEAAVALEDRPELPAPARGGLPARPLPPADHTQIAMRWPSRISPFLHKSTVSRVARSLHRAPRTRQVHAGPSADPYRCEWCGSRIDAKQNQQKQRCICLTRGSRACAAL